MLNGLPLTDYSAVSPAWFEQVATVPVGHEDALVGPLAEAAGEFSGATGSGGVAAAVGGDRWIVRLTEPATRLAGTVRETERLLDAPGVDFQVIRGLGLPGEVLVRSTLSPQEAEAQLACNPRVAHFERDVAVYAQIAPNDPEFPSLTGLHNVGQFGATGDADIDAPEAWDMNTGSTNVIVGVIDSGIDVTHPDLYLNIWLNQGEIRPSLKSQLHDTDSDSRYTFYDLNHSDNASLVRDLNGNTYIDAGDLIADPLWADGVDTDRNGFVDDFFGWNFRVAAAEPFAPNDPQDALGHGTHVAGTIGAMGNNSRGVTGINWQSSLMALRFLDASNQGLTSDAVLAVNYATMMRTDFRENVRVLNASWGQSGRASPALRSAIEAAGQADMLFVAAAGNGNILGQGINIDREPFYPASYDLGNVISVAATDPTDQLARFSNFGAGSVDLAAPGVGVLSTLPRGRYGTANGTSMAAPHVAGMAALVWSDVPEANAAEVRQAILGSVDRLTELSTVTLTGGRLNAARSIESDAFAPQAALDSAADITTAGGTENLITVRYHDRLGIDDTSLDDADLIVNRQWGPKDPLGATLVPGSVMLAPDGKSATATYRLAAPGDTWDALDYGGYVVSVPERQVRNAYGLYVPAGAIGRFSVRIADPSIFYVDTFADAVDANIGDRIGADASGSRTLRAAIQEANAAAPQPTTIILEKPGTYGLSLPPVPDPSVPFPIPSPQSGCVASWYLPTWSNETSGDLDVLGNVTIAGDDADTTSIDAGGIDRVIKVYPGANLVLQGMRVTGGDAPGDQGGGGILTSGSLGLDGVVVQDNSALGGFHALGGGIAVWDGEAAIRRSTILENQARGGGGVFVCNFADLSIAESTIASNVARSVEWNARGPVSDFANSPNGAGVLSALGGPVSIANSTISGNSIEHNIGSAIRVEEDSTLETDDPAGTSDSPALSADGRLVAFRSDAAHLVPNDTNGTSDIFVFDSQSGQVTRVSVGTDGTQADGPSQQPAISADGRFVAFSSDATNLVPGDTNASRDIFVVDLQNHTLKRVSIGIGGVQANGPSDFPALAADGRFVAFSSLASNLVADDTNGVADGFLVDRTSGSITRVSVGNEGIQANGVSGAPKISADARFIAFSSLASNLVLGDTNSAIDGFLFDRASGSLTRISMGYDGAQANGHTTVTALSADGRFVAFSSVAANLVPADTNNATDAFVFDRDTGGVTRVSMASDGSQGNAQSTNPALSADGRLVAFTSDASNLVSGDVEAVTDVFLVDRQQSELIRVKVGTQGQTRLGPTSLSADGRFVAFASHASGGSGESEIFVFDRQNGHVTWVRGEVTAILENVTVVDNHGIFGPIGVYGPIEIHNSLFASSPTDGGAIDLSSGIVSQGHNLVSNSSLYGVFANASDRIDPQTRNLLGPLQDNGGSTWTHAPLAGSAAIDAGDPTFHPPTDQRGILRPQDGDGARGAQPEIGAVELFDAAIRGTVFLDRDGDGTRDATEPGLAGEFVFLDDNLNGQYDSGEPFTWTRKEDPASTTVFEEGTFSFEALAPRYHRVVPVLRTGWSQQVRGSVRVDVAADSTPADNMSFSPSLSRDGRFVVFWSWASNLVPGDTNGASDVFVYDRLNCAMTRVSMSQGGSQADGVSRDPAVSADGRFVAFPSTATNLVPGDTNDNLDVFLIDRQQNTIAKLTDDNADSWLPSISADGQVVTFRSDPDSGPSVIVVFDGEIQSLTTVAPTESGWDGPSVSADGRFVAFASYASDLVPDDTNGTRDIFVYDRWTLSFTRVSVASDGTQANENSGWASLSADGRFVAFASEASNLVTGDTNEAWDVFVFDRQTHSVTRVSVAEDGTQGDGSAEFPSISDDGRFVAFWSDATNLDSSATNGLGSMYVFDRQNHDLTTVFALTEGTHAGDTRPVSISGDGTIVANQDVVFFSLSSAIYVTPNRNALGSGAKGVEVYAGQSLASVDFALMPSPGEISGRCFQDLIANGISDAGESGQTGCTVFIDANTNGRLDPGEVSTSTGTDGTYAFTNLQSETQYRIATVVPNGSTLVLPSADENGAWSVFLPAGGIITDRDFGLREFQTGGQFEDAVVTGRVLIGSESDGPGQGSGERGLAGATVFLDLDDDRVRQHDEPRTVSASDDPATPNIDETGIYTFDHLGNRPYAVRVEDVTHYRQTSPVGNDFSKHVYSLAVPGTPLGSPQDVAVADFNGDGWNDLATAVFDRNAVAVRLNDGQGGFSPAPVEVPLEPLGYNPIALLGADFDRDGRADLAVVNNPSSNVAILLDFDGTGFRSKRYVTVGTWPNAITASDLDGDDYLDLVVTNEKDNTLSILRNDRQGYFAPDSTAPAVGNNPFDAVAGDFNEDGRLDLAVADFGRDTDPGDVRLLLANSTGGFQASAAFPVGFGPASLVAKDLNGDSHLDLAVANFLSNTITVAQGVGNGTFTPVATLPTGEGPMDLEVVDVDNDTDWDLVVTTGKSKEVGILRNRLRQGAFEFEPMESFGVANFPDAARVFLGTGDLDKSGTVDFAVVNGRENSVAVHLNTLVTGAQRLALTGVGIQTDVNFVFQAVNAAPTLDAIASPAPILEDAGQQAVTLTGISAGAGENQPFTVTAVSSDPTLVSNPVVEPGASGGTRILHYTPQRDRYGTAVITVTVMDAGLDGNPDTSEGNGQTLRSFTVTVQPLNDPPTLDRIADRPAIQEDASPAPLTLTGIGAGGGEDQQLRVEATSTNPALIASVNVDYTSPGNTATVSYTLQDHANGTAVITVTVTDAGLDDQWATAGDNLSFSQSFGVSVNPVNASPTLEPIPNPAALDEDTTQVQTVTLSGITAGTGESQRLRVVATSDKPGLVPDPTVSYASPATTGQLTYTPLPEQNGTANITVTVIDGGPDDDPDTNDGNGSFSRVFTVTVRAVEDPPRLAAGQTFRLDEQSAKDTLVGTIQATDSDVGDSISYTIAAGNIANAFAIDTATGTLRVATPAALDFETTPQFNLTVQAEDRTGRTDASAVRIDLNNVNDAPLANHDNVETQEDQAFDIPWQSLFANDSDVDSPQSQWSVVSVAAAANGTAVNDPANRRIRFTPDTDFRGRGSFVYTLDDGGGLRDNAAVVVRVSVANQAPTGLSLSNAVIPESIATTTAALVGTLTAEDPDAGDQHVFALVAGDRATDNGYFRIADNRLEVNAGTPVDYEAQRQYSVRVQVSDGLAILQKAFTIQVTDVNEFAPLIEPQTLHVAELSVYGASVGTVVAQDGDRWQTLRFAITGGNAGGAFGILPDSGEMVVTNGGQLDYETQATYTLTVTVSDSGQPLRTGTGTVTVMVDDVNEAPIFLSVRERVEGEYVGVVPVSDPDAKDTLSFTISNDGRFEVTADGRLRLKAGTSLDGKQGSVVNLQVTATDGGQPPLSRTQDFVIQVLANEHPWQNPVRANDVNARDGVQPEDVLLLINEINRRSSGSAGSQLPPTRPALALYLDPTGDDTITAADVLDAINEINRRASGGEGEAAVVPPADWWAAPSPNAESRSPRVPHLQQRSQRSVTAAMRHSASDACRVQPVPAAETQPRFSADAVSGEWEELLQLLAEEASGDAV